MCKNGIKIGIHETGEIFDSREALAQELGIHISTLGNYLYNNKSWNGLHFYKIHPSEYGYVCSVCGVPLTEKNNAKPNSKNSDYLCLDCSRRRARKQNKKQRNKYPMKGKIGSLKRRIGSCKVTEDELMNLWKEQGGCCNICGDTIEIRPSHLDHIIPSSNGGASTKENLQFLCEKCNRGKFTWTQKEYIEHCKKVAMTTEADF